MNKAVIFLLGLGMTSAVSAQKQDRLAQKLERDRIENQQKIENYISKQGRENFTETEIAEMKATVAGFIDGRPYFWQTDDLAANRSANLVNLQNGSYTGLNGLPIDGEGQNIMVMDGGRVYDRHVDFGASSTGVPPAVPRVFDMEGGTVGYNFHATNVAGIIASEGIANSNDIGVIKKAKINSYSFNTTAQGTNYQKLASSPNANISNHSYGIVRGWRQEGANWYWEGDYNLTPTDTWSGAYVSNDATYDAIVYDNPNQIVIKSAGNYFGDGPSGSYVNAFKNVNGSWVPFTPSDVIPANNCSDNYNCIGWGSLAKNLIIVGATNRLATLGQLYTQPSDVVKAGFSSAGPRKDGAIKPDIAATGVSMVMPTYTSSTNYTAVSTSQGTSYSAPVISGIAGALTHVQRNLSGNASFMFKADEMKALLMHTTNEAGPNPGPDVWFGWGFADASQGAQVLIDNAANKNIFSRNVLTSGTPNNRVVVGQAGSPLKATISWIDPEGVPFTNSNDMWQNRTPRLINDFDLRIIDMVTNEVTYPWKIDALNPMAAATKGDNVVDNIEQVLLENPVAGRQYRVEVSNKGTLKDDSGAPMPQFYALVVTGYDFNATNQLSVKDIDPKEGIAVYPTITSDYVTVVNPLKMGRITMHDMSGKMVLNVKAKDTQMIDMTSMPKGVYLINIETEHGNVTKKVIRK